MKSEPLGASAPKGSLRDGCVPQTPSKSSFSDYFGSLSSSPRPELGEGLGVRANAGLEVGVAGGLAIALAVVSRFVTWFPFDVAADAGHLLRADGLVG